MRVLQIGPYPPPYGGVQVNILAIRKCLLEKGIPCYVINITRHRHSKDQDVYHPRNAFEVIKLLLRLEFDIAHLHIGGNLTPRLLGLCLFCTLLPKCKTVLTFHSGGYPSSKQGKRAHHLTLRGFIFRRLDRIIAVNREIYDMFKKFGVDERKIRLICPFALPQHNNKPLPQEISDFLNSHSPVLLTVGLLEPEYNLHLQIDSLGLLLNRHPQAGLIIIGSGSLENELQCYINSKPYSRNILLCGDVEHEVTIQTMSKSDLFLRTTSYDGDAISIREALHLGIPVIATDNRMRPEGVKLLPSTRLNPHDLFEEVLYVLQTSILSRGIKSDTPNANNIEEVLNLYENIST